MMKALKVISIILLVSAFTLNDAWCQGKKEISEYPYSDSGVMLPCLDGYFSVEGHVKMTFYSTTKGKFEYREKAVYTNEITGEEFYFSGISNQNWNWKPGAANHEQMTITYCLEDCDGNVIYNSHRTYHLQFNSKEELVNYFDHLDHFDIVCGGN